ncbi:MAG: hypothetical protein WCR54_02390 [Clostridia bacterium]
MNELQLTQNYYVCTIHEKDKFPKGFSKTTGILIIACMIELYQCKIIDLENKNYVKLVNPLPDEQKYLSSIYDYLVKKGKCKIATLVAYFNITMPKYKNIIINEIIQSLPKEVDIDIIIEKIRKEILGDKAVSTDYSILIMLLYHNDVLKSYFSEVENNTLDKKLEEIKKSPEYLEFIRISETIAK